MANFKKALEKRMQTIAIEAVGPLQTVVPKVLTFDDYLHDTAIETLPYIVTFVLFKEKESSEIAKFGNWVWTGHVYYLDTTKPNETHDQGKDRRDEIMDVLENAYEGNHFMADSTGPLASVNAKGVPERPWQTEVTAVSFDETGQEGYYTFTSEMYISVHTQKS